MPSGEEPQLNALWMRFLTLTDARTTGPRPGHREPLKLRLPGDDLPGAGPGGSPVRVPGDIAADRQRASHERDEMKTPMLADVPAERIGSTHGRDRDPARRALRPGASGRQTEPAASSMV